VNLYFVFKNDDILQSMLLRKKELSKYVSSTVEPAAAVTAA